MPNPNRAWEVAVVSELPDCNFCNSKEGRFDAPVKQGNLNRLIWANLCLTCYSIKVSAGFIDPRLGVGKGQILIETSETDYQFKDEN
jgi:hypothetical protein